MDDPLLESLCQSGRVARLVWDLCEFGVVREKTPDWFRMKSGEVTCVAGKDGSGGRFCLCRDAAGHAGRLLYVTSEGQAGILAPSLKEGVKIMIALPYWWDCLKFSGGGKIWEMKRAAAQFEEALRSRRPAIDDERRMLFEMLRLRPLKSPLEMLHQSVTDGAGTKIVDPGDGNPYQSLFNKFTVGGLI
jgi:hypothetical protein